MACQWTLSYDSVDDFLEACKGSNDPLRIRYVVFLCLTVSTQYELLDPFRQARHLQRIEDFAERLPAWRLERLPPPRTNQSQVSSF